jgi:hypothetical protein
MVDEAVAASSCKESSQQPASRKNMAGIRAGTKHYKAILTEDQVREIRSLRGVMSQRAIGARFGVHKETVASILRGENWAWLE